MKTDPSDSTWINDIGVCLFLIVVAAAFLIDSRGIQAGGFDGVGAAPVPRFICWAVIVLCLAVMGRSFIGRRKETPAPPVNPAPESGADSGAESNTGPDGTKPPPRLLLAAGVLGLTGLYILALGTVNLAAATTVYLTLATGLLVRFEKRSTLIGFAIALAMGIGCQILFTQILVLDL
jgi:hypothetical protein